MVTTTRNTHSRSGSRVGFRRVYVHCRSATRLDFHWARALCFCCLLSQTLSAQTNIEHFEYQVAVDGKESGTLTIEYVAESPDTIHAEIRSRVTCKYLLMKYVFALHVVERWQAGQLVALVGAVDDNGQQNRIKLKPNGDSQVLFVNDQLEGSTACVGSTTMALCPQTPQVDRRLLDIETGKTADTNWRDTGVEILSVSGRQLECHHYKVTGDQTTELWFGGQQRLLKQSLRDSGFEIVINRIR